MTKEWVCVPEMGTPSNLPARTLDVASKPPTWAYLLAENPPLGPCARHSPNSAHLGRRRAAGVPDAPLPAGSVEREVRPADARGVALPSRARGRDVRRVVHELRVHAGGIEGVVPLVLGGVAAGAWRDVSSEAERGETREKRGAWQVPRRSPLTCVDEHAARGVLPQVPHRHLQPAPGHCDPPAVRAGLVRVGRPEGRVEAPLVPVAVPGGGGARGRDLAARGGGGGGGRRRVSSVAVPRGRAGRLGLGDERWRIGGMCVAAPGAGESVRAR